jgi:hypothetical protein
MGYQLVETIEVGSGGAASIEFTGIPDDGVDLVVKASFRTDNASLQRFIFTTFNNDTGANYTTVRLYGNGSTTGSTITTSGDKIFGPQATGASATSNTFTSCSIYISNYSSNSSKSLHIDNVTENNAIEAYQSLFSGSWNNTAAISTITLLAQPSANLVQYTTASLYKITAD